MNVRDRTSGQPTLGKGRKIAGVLVVLALIAVVSDYLWTAQKGRRTAPTQVSLIDGPWLLNVDRIVVTKSSERVELRKKDAFWYLGGDDKLRVDAQRLAELIDQLRSAVVEQREKVTDADFSKYGFAETDQPSQIELGSGDSISRKFVLGKSPPSGGVFVLEQPSLQLFVLKEPFKLVNKAADWEYKVLVKVKPAAIKEVSFAPPAARKGARPAIVARQKPEDSFALVGVISAAESPNEAMIKGLSNILASVAFEKRLPRSDTSLVSLEDMGRATVETFGGLKYNVQVWATALLKGQQRRYFIDLTREIAVQPPAAAAEIEYEFPDISAGAPRWYFEANSASALGFIKGREDMMAKKGK